MANKWSYLTILSVMAASSSSAEGWGRHTYSHTYFSNPEQSVQSKDTSNQFPLNLDQQWYTKESYLLWKPYAEDVDFGNYVSNKVANEFNTTIQKPHYDWSSGVRVMIGRYLPRHDQWDIFGGMTYYYNGASSHRSATPGLSWIDPMWYTTRFQASESSVHFQTNYFVWDLLAGRNYTLTSTVNIHPFIGLRALLLDQSYRNKNSGFLDREAYSFTFKADNDFAGAGPRIGTDLAFYFGRGWSILGSLSGAFVCGHYNIRQTIDASNPGDEKGLTKLKVALKDGDTVLRSNLEASVGLGWEKWYKNHTVRIAPSFMVEATEWFSVNHWITTVGGKSTTGMPRHYGNLAFWGFSFNLQVDF